MTYTHWREFLNKYPQFDPLPPSDKDDLIGQAGTICGKSVTVICRGWHYYQELTLPVVFLSNGEIWGKEFYYNFQATETAEAQPAQV